ncbi:MAG: M20/M25/M40 family metallo-hydrolase [Candidatus Binatia bacterium]|nr:M20/M25/M40 family metallo-hydrolase [Candidatus Binatia bacterium]
MSRSNARQWPWMLVAAALLLGAHSRAAEIDWAAVEAEGTQLLREYLRIDTTNPPGNELAAARFWEEKFRAAGLSPQVFETSPGRGGVWARLSGRGMGGAVVLLHHLDVVPAEPSQWKHPPFAAKEEGGYVYGRGAVDAKGLGVVQALAVLLLHRQGIVPARDVLFVATPDEEAGGRLGAGWFVEHLLPRLGRVEFVLNEGGHIRPMPSGKLAFEVAVAEKTPLWLRLTARGRAGHGSVPPAETAVTKLIQALARVHATPRALRVTDEVQRYFAALAPLQVGGQAAAFADLRASLVEERFRQQFLLEPRQAALVQDTIAITVLQGSPKTNVIPATAVAELDCRLLPGTEPQAFLERLMQAIADPTIQVETLLQFPPSSSSVDTALYAAIERVAERENGRVVPSVLTGFTDSHYFRERGIVSYGFAPFVMTETELQGMHGIDERISKKNLRDGTRRLIEILSELGK